MTARRLQCALLVAVSEQLTTILVRLALVWGAVGLWALTVLYVFRDGRHRGYGSRRVLRWTLAALLLPFVGFVAYLTAWRREVAPRRHQTVVRRPAASPDDAADPSTVPAAYWRAPSQREEEEDDWVLYGEAGPYTGQSFRVETFPARIGRAADCALCLEEDIAVSRRHAELYQRDGQLRLRDLNSTHGTYLNGRPMTDEQLHFGDRIRIGNTVLVVAERK